MVTIKNIILSVTRIAITFVVCVFVRPIAIAIFVVVAADYICSPIKDFSLQGMGLLVSRPIPGENARNFTSPPKP